MNMTGSKPVFRKEASRRTATTNYFQEINFLKTQLVVLLFFIFCIVLQPVFHYSRLAL